MTSTSWPTAETTGTADAATARTTDSSLNAARSSFEPPPRARMTTSAEPATRENARRARTISPAAAGPWTDAG